MSYTVSINNKRIHDFYKNNPSIDVESLNLLMIDFIEKLNTDMSKTLTETINKEILRNVNNLEQNVRTINKDYIETIKTTMKINSNEESVKLSSLINKSTQQFTDKINEVTENKFKTTLNDFNNNIIKELKENNNSDNFIKKFESKLQTIQQPMYSFISSQQELLVKKMNENSNDKSKMDDVLNELSDFLNKMKNSSVHKGNYGQNILENVLNSAFPSSQIVNTSGTKASGDFMIKRDNKPVILVENKDYKYNVNADEVKKFIRDINEQNTHGIFLSQHSGITTKTNYTIDIYEGKVLVYLHNVEYNPDIIKCAVNIIDNLAYKVEIIENDEGETISKETLQKINSDFQVFLTKKQLAIDTAKDIQKKLLVHIEDIAFPTLSDWLSNKGVNMNNACTYHCEICSQVFTNKRALASHKKVHKNNEPIKNVIIDASSS